MTKILVTGGAGFAGHHLVEALLKKTDWDITLIDRLDSSGNLNRLAEVGAAKNPRVRFVYHDLRAPMNAQLTGQVGPHDYIVHMAAATHVDRSIDNPMEFVLDNVVATTNMLDFARATGCEKFINFSTDEVFGPAPAGMKYKEDDRYNAGNPYAATKAGAVQMGTAYHNTYKVPVITTHTMNIFGERQHPEKYIPMTIAKVLKGDVVYVHANKTKTQAGSRFYIHARNVADGVLHLLAKGAAGEKYNLVGEREVNNFELAQFIASALDKPLRHEMVDFHSSRPGHDLRYALDGSKMAGLGWKPPVSFEASLGKVIQWMLYGPLNDLA